MAKNIKTRKGADGNYYPYTSPDIVIDANGKSVTTKFNELETKIDSSTSIDDANTAENKTWSSSKISSQFKDIANNFTTEQTDTEIILKYGNTTILTIPLNNLTPTEKAELLSSNLCFYEPTDVPNTWVTDSTGKVLTVDTEAFYDLFYDPYVGTNSDGYIVTKTELGKDQSNTYPLYEYDFKPKNYNRTILLSSGMHTYELSAHFGCGWLIKSIMEKHNDNLMLKYLYENVRIKIIPIINPWGWNQSPKKYGNSNGVNINRNFDCKDDNGNSIWDSFPTYTPSQNEWNVKGSSPFSESETQILKNWVLKNKDVAEFWIDCHTGLGLGPFDNFIYYNSNNPLKSKIEKALERLNNRIKTKYNVSQVNNSILIDHQTSLRIYWSQKIANLSSMTIEQTPNNTKWGTSLNNESGDIANYCTTLLTYIMEFLVTKYDDFKQTYTITNNLSNSINSNTITSITEGTNYNAKISAYNGYEINSINVTMGGVDITSDVVNNDVIAIPSVTGNIVIEVTTTKISNSFIESGTLDINGNDVNDATRFRTNYIELSDAEINVEDVSTTLIKKTVDYNNGSEIDHTGRVCTDYIALNGKKVILIESSVFSDAVLRYFKYENGAYNFIGSSGSTWSNSFAVNNANVTHVRIVFRKDINNTEIKDSDLDISKTKIKLYNTPAFSLSLNLGTNYTYYIRLYDKEKQCLGDFNILASNTLTKNSNNSYNGEGVIVYLNQNLKYIRFIGMNVTDNITEIDINNLEGSIEVDGITYDLKNS